MDATQRPWRSSFGQARDRSRQAEDHGLAPAGEPLETDDIAGEDVAGTDDSGLSRPAEKMKRL
ncbi:hypothetical protein SLT36_18965 [Aminobacter sp. BA135]|uniref:hypothetical protein n=1 Tax=Aminobacter sp. BA135 TaxID=537596 RepID=UPI003D7A185F